MSDMHPLSEFLELSAEILLKQISAVRLFTGHAPTFGSACENLLRNFLSTHIPAPFQVATGFLHDPGTGKSSKQCDVIIYNPSKGPIYFRNGDLVIVSPASVEFVIEVKGNLSTKEQLDESIENLLSVKQFGHRTRWCLLTFGASIPAKRIEIYLHQRPKELQFGEMPDILVSLDQERWLFMLWTEFQALRRFVTPPDSLLGFNYLYSRIMAWLQGKSESEIYIDFQRRMTVGRLRPIKIGKPLTDQEKQLLECDWLLERGKFKDCLKSLGKYNLESNLARFALKVRCLYYLGRIIEGLEAIANAPTGATVDKKIYVNLLVLAKKFDKVSQILDALIPEEKNDPEWQASKIENLVHLGKYDEALLVIEELKDKLPEYTGLNILKLWALKEKADLKTFSLESKKLWKKDAVTPDDLWMNALIEALRGRRKSCTAILCKLQATNPLPTSVIANNKIFADILKKRDFDLLASIAA